MEITCISDLHGYYPKLEGGDLLIIAGDLCENDSLDCINNFKFSVELYSKVYQIIIMVAGNHDNWIQNGLFFNRNKECWDNTFLSYLEDSGTEFKGLKIYGSPWTKTFPGMNPNCKAFTVDTDEELKAKWDLIPSDTDILITHCPPHGIMDKSYGSTSLRKIVSSRERLPNLKLHCFGHASFLKLCL